MGEKQKVSGNNGQLRFRPQPQVEHLLGAGRAARHVPTGGVPREKVENQTKRFTEAATEASPYPTDGTKNNANISLKIPGLDCAI